MLLAFVLWAQEAKDVVEKTEPTAPGWATFMPFIVLIALFYFLLIRPAQRRERMMREHINTSLKKNVEVVTTGGIIGTVTHIKENGEEVTIRIDDNAKMRILRSSIARILTPTESEAMAKDTPPAGKDNAAKDTGIKPAK
jgi:preprotein translocase subunit YajC